MSVVSDHVIKASGLWEGHHVCNFSKGLDLAKFKIATGPGLMTTHMNWSLNNTEITNTEATKTWEIFLRRGHVPSAVSKRVFSTKILQVLVTLQHHLLIDQLVEPPRLKPMASKHIETLTKMPTFCKRHFQIHSFVRKMSCINSISTTYIPGDSSNIRPLFPR